MEPAKFQFQIQNKHTKSENALIAMQFRNESFVMCPRGKVLIVYLTACSYHWYTIGVTIRIANDDISCNLEKYI
jgi:hypothetical protein